MKGLFLSVGLCTYNRADFLSRVLDMLQAQTLNPAQFEILVIDNNSTDNTREVIKQFAENNPHLVVRYYLETSQGVSHARNRAYREAHGEYVVYIDDDELAEPDWLETYHHFITKNPGAAIYAGRILIGYLNGPPEWSSEYVESWYGKYDFGSQPLEITDETLKARQVALPNAGNMAVRVEFLKACEGFDLTLGRKGNRMLGGEETQLALLALRQAERMVYNPASIITHIVFPTRLSIAFLREKHFMQGRSSFLLYREEMLRRGVVRLFAGKMVYCLHLLSGLLNFNRHKKLEASLRLVFEWGVITGFLMEECRA